MMQIRQAFMTAKDDRRNQARQDIRLPVAVHRSGTGSPSWLRGWTLNACEGGMLIECELQHQHAPADFNVDDLCLAPLSVSVDQWHKLGQVQVVRTEVLGRILLVAVRLFGVERSLLTMPQFVGRSRASHSVRKQMMEAARCDFNVLITGETGTGKTLAAECIHRNSDRFKNPFIRVNCPNISPSLFESELFGHEKGAFTDAKSSTPGFLRVAGAGTVLLDEISELAPPLQAKLLRVLDERRFVPVGGHQHVEMQCRVIATSNADLKSLIRKGTFRSDLYYRLNEIPVEIPPLRARREDVPLLAEVLLRRHSLSTRLQVQRELSAEDAALLMQCEWPGNVRELSNSMKLWLIGRPISGCCEFPGNRQQLADSMSRIAVGIGGGNGSLADIKREILERTELESIRAALASCGDNHTHAAAMLGISYRTLARKLARIGTSDAQ